MERRQLLQTALLKVVSGILLMGVLLFLPAGTLAYPGGRRLMAFLFLPMVLVGFALMAGNPKLLEKRLKAKEDQGDQKMVILLSAVEFILCFILSGLDFRFGWTMVPAWAVTSGTVVFFLSYALYGEVIRENQFLSRTVEIQKDQKVVSTGLYGIVRHPMYFAVVFLFLSMPMILGSWIGFASMLPFPFLLVKRIQNEEKVLEEGLPGYLEYEKKVRWHMLPFLW